MVNFSCHSIFATLLQTLLKIIIKFKPKDLHELNYMTYTMSISLLSQHYDNTYHKSDILDCVCV